MKEVNFSQLIKVDKNIYEDKDGILWNIKWKLNKGWQVKEIKKK